MKHLLNCSALALALYMASAAAADGYVTAGEDPGVPVRSRYGECVHDSEYRPDMRFADCEPAPVKAVEAPAPQAEPAPVVVEAPAPQPMPQNVPFRLASETFFDFDKATLTPEGQAALDDVASRLAVSQFDKVTVVGHTDRIGTAAYNQKLSERRARAMADYLIAKGVDAQKIETAGLGSQNPTAQCSGLRGAKLIGCLQPDRYAELTTTGTEVQVSQAAAN
jgi:OOP family OmpA-OmpF porin